MWFYTTVESKCHRIRDENYKVVLKNFIVPSLYKLVSDKAMHVVRFMVLKLYQVNQELLGDGGLGHTLLFYILLYYFPRL